MACYIYEKLEANEDGLYTSGDFSRLSGLSDRFFSNPKEYLNGFKSLKVGKSVFVSVPPYIKALFDDGYTSFQLKDKDDFKACEIAVRLTARTTLGFYK